ncbi:aspartic peptidase domain-containing protein [Trametes gibbosa]|nr:aspartic peptidase domain-containing protein [Trametes gibbosa]
MGRFSSLLNLRLFTLLPLVHYAAAFSKPADMGIHVKSHYNQHGVGVSTADDLVYTVDITLGGQNFTVMFDTGSTDLWINSQNLELMLTNTTDLAITEVYGIGQVDGTLQFAELKIGDYVVPSQAFVNATQITDFDLNVDGILGMSFDVSNIFVAVEAAWGTECGSVLGRSFINNLFAENPSVPNNFDVQLGRTDAQDEDALGTFVISNHAPHFKHVTKAPKLPRVGTSRWTFSVDGMAVNGESFEFQPTAQPVAPDSRLVALLDTGFSFPPIPPAAVDAIYKSIPGSVFWPSQNTYVVPCNSSTMLSFFFGGQEFPVHPLDLTFPYATTVFQNGVQKSVAICIGTYQYFTLDPTSFDFDLALGDAFLRSVYASFDYGDFDPVTNVEGVPFVQLLSTTNNRTALAEFFEERAKTLANLPPTISPAEFIRLTNSDADSSDSAIAGAAALDDGADTGLISGTNKTFKIAALSLLGMNLLVGLALLGVTVTMCVRARKGRSAGRASSSQYAPVTFKEMEGGEPETQSGGLRYSDL